MVCNKHNLYTYRSSYIWLMVYFETLARCYYGILCLSEESFKDFLLISIGNLNLLSIKNMGKNNC